MKNDDESSDSTPPHLVSEMGSQDDDNNVQTQAEVGESAVIALRREEEATSRERYNAKFGSGRNPPPSDISARSKYYQYREAKSMGTSATNASQQEETTPRERYNAKFGNEQNPPSDSARSTYHEQEEEATKRQRYNAKFDGERNPHSTGKETHDAQSEATARQRYNAKFGGVTHDIPNDNETSVARKKNGDMNPTAEISAEGIPVAQTAPGGAWTMAWNKTNTGEEHHHTEVSSNSNEESPGRTSLPRRAGGSPSREEMRPGAVRVAGWQDEAPYESSDDDGNDDDDVINEPTALVPELSAVLATGNVNQDRQELQQLREQLARAVEAQAVRMEEGSNGIDDEESTGIPDASPSGFLKYGSKGMLWCLGSFLVVASVVVGCTVGLKVGGREVPLPTETPTPAPTPDAFAPVLAPSSAPTQEPNCLLGINVSCSILDANNLDTGKSTPCSNWTPPQVTLEPCYHTPYRAGFLFIGGGCNQSDNAGLLNLTCNDTMNGPPPAEVGSQLYIIVTDSDAGGFQGRRYFQGFVTVGEVFYIEDPERGLIDVGVRIAIFRSDDIRDPSNLLQEVHHHDVLCSTPLEFMSRFGAVQLVEYENEVQGIVSSFAGALLPPLTLSIDVHRLDSWPGTVTMTGLKALTNFAGFMDLSDDVVGTQIQQGGSISLRYPLFIDLTVLRRYTVITEANALFGSGDICYASDFNSFNAGGR